jgi:hypothetical protein
LAREARRGYRALCISRCGCVGRVEDGVLTRVDPDQVAGSNSLRHFPSEVRPAG